MKTLPAVRPPEQVRGRASSNESVELRWGSSTGSNTYNIYRDGNFLVNVTGTTFTDTGLTEGTTYQYEVEGLSSNDVVSPNRSHIAYVTCAVDGNGNAGSEAAVTGGQRYDATQGEIFWERGAFTQFDVYRDGVIQPPTPNNGASLYQDNLTGGVSYQYEVRGLEGTTETSLGTVTLPETAGPGTVGNTGGGNGAPTLTVNQTGPTVTGTVSSHFFNRGVYLPIGGGHTANADGNGNWSITLTEPSQNNVNAYVANADGSISATAMFNYTN